MISFKAYLTELRKVPQLNDFIKQHISKEIIAIDPYSDLQRYKLRKSDAAADLIHKINFKPLGRGAYAIVIGSDSYPYVVKIFDLRDKGFATWINFVINNQNNPYVPKIRGRPTTIPKTGHGFIRMEKLREITTNEELEFKKEFWTGNNPHMEQIKNFIANSGHHNDMSSDNIMVRPNGHVVVTDPLS